jgi:hypothetical protein
MTESIRPPAGLDRLLEKAAECSLSPGGKKRFWECDFGTASIFFKKFQKTT